MALGGRSGAGGKIYYSNAENIFAFNGDMITNNDYETKYYEYDKYGNQTATVLKVYKRQNANGETIQFIPAKIFAQSGTIRATYRSNQGATDLSKVQIENDYKIAKSYYELQNCLATPETEIAVTEYTNPLAKELPNQGIGSGARIFRNFKWKF